MTIPPRPNFAPRPRDGYGADSLHAVTERLDHMITLLELLLQPRITIPAVGEPPRKDTIKLTAAEIAVCCNRVELAEGLIEQLPLEHDGRQLWLMSYGVGTEAHALRKARGMGWDDETQAVDTLNRR